ncbi:MAG: M20/M25/M40 family metallo-hydrolase [Phycisphaerae bacterium]
MIRTTARLAIVAALLCLTACQQPHAATLDRLVIGEVMTSSELPENLRALCLPGGRLSGTPNAQTAVEFVADKAREYGLKNVHCEPFTMPGWQVNRTVVTVPGEPDRVLADAVALWLSRSTPEGGLTAELIDVGDGTPDDFASVGDAMRGRFALVRDGHGRRSAKMLLAREHGAVGMIVAERPGRAPIISTCHREPRPEPAVVIRREDADQFAETLAAGGTVQLNVQVDADFWDGHPNNVVAEIPGHGPLAHEVVILSAHLDSWHLAEGAMDNGAGSTAILEAARALAAVGWQPRRTVRFAWFQGEEQGLWGSKAYVAAHEREMADIVVAVNSDMPGSPRQWHTSGGPSAKTFLQALRGRLAGYELSNEVATLGGQWSDHAPFCDAGVCTMTLGGELGEGVIHYHTAGDKYDVVDRRATAEAAAVLAVLIRNLADAPASTLADFKPSPTTQPE